MTILRPTAALAALVVAMTLACGAPAPGVVSPEPSAPKPRKNKHPAKEATTQISGWIEPMDWTEDEVVQLTNQEGMHILLCLDMDDCQPLRDHHHDSSWLFTAQVHRLSVEELGALPGADGEVTPGIVRWEVLSMTAAPR